MRARLCAWEEQCGRGRFRINLHQERGRAAAAIRRLPAQVPSLGQLHLPPEVERLADLGPGLILVGGATGSGKTTTLAALVDLINRRDRKHIITIEDPIEYEHSHQSSLVEHVEVGADTPDFGTALRAAVRQAPNVIVVGEMGDAETMRIALGAAETGHQVFSTLHTTDVASTIGRIADSFPPERQPTIRQELAMALSAVLTQRLVPAQDGVRVPACELLIVGYGGRQHIRKNALQHLHQDRRPPRPTLGGSDRLVLQIATGSRRFCSRIVTTPWISLHRRADGWGRRTQRIGQTIRPIAGIMGNR